MKEIKEYVVERRRLIMVCDDGEKVILKKDDFTVLAGHDIKKSDLVSGNLMCYYQDGKLIIRTNEESWKNLAGREWTYDMNERTFILSNMN